MPRKRPNDGTTAPKPPRVRKKKADAEPKIEAPVYEPLMQSTNMIMDDGMFTHTQDYGYAYGSQPAGFGAESAPSPFIVPQSTTPQPMMMRPPPMAQNVPSQGGIPAQPPPQGTPMAAPSPTLLEFRLHEMNRRLFTFSNSGISEKDYTQWWDAFSHEFFDDDARMCITLADPTIDQKMPEKFIIGRQLIPRFFRSFMESGVKEMYYVIQGATREAQSPNCFISFENENILQVIRFDQPCPFEIRVDCKLQLEFTHYDELLNHRIRIFNIEFRQKQEYFVDEMSKEAQPILDRPDILSMTGRAGLPRKVLECLDVSRVLEPMQIIMSHYKMSPPTDTPRETLRRTLFSHQANLHRMSQPPMIPPSQVEEQKPKPARKRTRKPAANSKAKKANASPAPSNPSFPQNTMPGTFNAMGPYNDVMVVGEPSMMGGDFGDEDERTISRVENSQYDPSALQMQQAMSAMSANMMPGQGMPPGGPPIGHMPPPNGMPPHSMSGPPGMPGHPGQMPPQLVPPQNGLPPPYAYGQAPPSWPSQPPNTTMITG